jgi:hypothetical protein
MSGALISVTWIGLRICAAFFVFLVVLTLVESWRKK